MTETLLIKDTKKRPSLAEIFKMPTMIQKMKEFNYDFEAHLAEIEASKTGKAPKVEEKKSSSVSSAKVTVTVSKGSSNS